jgi:hypothetical protein
MLKLREINLGLSGCQESGACPPSQVTCYGGQAAVAYATSSLRPWLRPGRRKDIKDESQNSLREKVEDRRSDLGFLFWLVTAPEIIAQILPVRIN